MNLGTLIEELKKYSKTQKVCLISPNNTEFSPTGIFSCYRGYYDELSINITPYDPKKTLTVGKFITLLKKQVGKTYSGYKGGEYIMHECTPCWLSVGSYDNTQWKVGEVYENSFDDHDIFIKSFLDD